MPVNPIKFVTIFNSRSGNNQTIPLATWESLSTQPKTMKHLQFLFNSDEDGNRVEQPRIETFKPIPEQVKDIKSKVNPDKAKANNAINEFAKDK